MHRWITMGGVWLAIAVPARAADKATAFDEGRLEVALPDGWKKSEQPDAAGRYTGGWESSDRKTSFYVVRVPSQAADMRTVLGAMIEEMDRDENWQLQKIGEYRHITLNGLPASYVKVDVELRSGARLVPFVFHFALVGGSNAFFLLQSSTMKPVWQPREDELIRMIKSFKVLKDE